MARSAGDKRRIVELGKRIYQEKLRDEAERSHMGQFVVVDVDSGDYEFGKNDVDAVQKMLERRPDALLYGVRVGEKAAYRFGLGRVGNAP